MIPSSVGTNRTTTSSVHSNSPKFGNINVSNNEAKLPSVQGQVAATRSASVPSGASVLKHQQRSLPAPPDEAKSNKDTFGEDNISGDRSRIPPSFYHNRGEYLKFS